MNNINFLYINLQNYTVGGQVTRFTLAIIKIHAGSSFINVF